jgi:lipopolysaccharide transport system ATP-binding protein
MVQDMSEIAISADGLGKRYRVGAHTNQFTMRERLTHAMTAPFRWLGPGRNGNGASAGARPDFWALRDVSFELRKGEVLGLIGRNGAGKSTLLKILSRVTQPTVGRAEIHGRVGSLLEVGTGFHPELTGRENTYLNGAILGMGKKEINRKFDEIVAFAEVEEFIDTPLKHYSSGMQMRLAFAVAAHLEPEILLVDEVLAVGDAQFQRKCLGKMSEVSQEGRTILFVSHNMIALRRLCTTALWIDGGKVVERGDAGKIIDHYLQTNLESRLESVWGEEDAPGNDRVRLRSARVILPEDFDGIITIHTPLQIEFTYWNFVPDAVLNLSMILFNSDDTCAFATVSDIVPRHAGLVRQIVQIPGNLLNAGSYYINILVVKDASAGILLENRVLAFEVAEGEIIGNWYGQTPGVVRPRLNWKSESVDSADFARAGAADRAT